MQMDLEIKEYPIQNLDHLSSHLLATLIPRHGKIAASTTAVVLLTGSGSCTKGVSGPSLTPQQISSLTFDLIQSTMGYIWAQCSSSVLFRWLSISPSLPITDGYSPRYIVLDSLFASSPSPTPSASRVSAKHDGEGEGGIGSGHILVQAENHIHTGLLPGYVVGWRIRSLLEGVRLGISWLFLDSCRRALGSCHAGHGQEKQPC
ncbi:MAG: hypothetical protein J3Q66DRAFT_71872 [Benniella sp.]|nr:MAG: hypothetical protein J3Q66DRAFT_71872 [Benniella sp.]